MILLKNFANITKIPELMKKLLFTVSVIVVYRIGAYIPVVGVNIPRLAEYLQRSELGGGLLGYIDLLSGGALSQCTLFALGIGPYITASIVMQMLSMTLPSLEQLMKEGEHGRRVVNQYTRYLTLVLAVLYSLPYAIYLENAGLVLNPGFGFKAICVLSLTVGAMIVMWLGEQISLMGLGNGSSMIIFAGIVARFPDHILRIINSVQIGNLAGIAAFLMLIIFVALTASIVFLEQGVRKIPVQYARRIIGSRVYGGQSTYIPFKINTAGVMPVIFAGSLLNIPVFASKMLSQRFEFFRHVSDSLVQTGYIYNILQFGLIVFFTYLYTSLVFNPTELAEQMKKGGGFVPGLRPGKQTADFFDYILTRIGLVGALYLGILSVLPNILLAMGLPFPIGGTSLLIVVGVMLEFASQVEAYLIEHRYEGFLASGRVRSRTVA